jgi:hypothetical protein
MATALLTATASIATAPIWYAVRGSFTEFWSNWWTYAGFMSSSTGRSLLNQIGLGGEKFFGYYQDRPGIALVIIVHIVLVTRNWRFMSTGIRTLHTMLLAWLSAGWIELVLSQRYSSHYFSIVALPTAFISVATAVLLLQSLRRTDDTNVAGSNHISTRFSWWVPIGCVLALMATQGTQLAWIAIEGAGRFRSTDHYVDARNDVRIGMHSTHQAVMDLVSSDDDPLLAWTMYPWTYLDHRRVPATRFSWKSFMIGEIYLGRTSSEYVLDRTWEWFAEDMNESRPNVFARPQVTDLQPATPLSALVAEEFTTVLADDTLEIAWRNELWETASGSRITDRPIEIDDLPRGWIHNPGTDTITADGLASQFDEGRWEVDATCQSLSTTIMRTSSADPMGLTFRFDSLDDSSRAVSLSVDFDRSWSARHDDGLVDSPQETDATVLSSSNRTSLGVNLIVTSTAAALIVDDIIVSAVPLTGPFRLTVEPSVDETEFSTPTTRQLDDFAGCPTR